MVQDIDKFAFEMTWQPGEKTYQSFRGNLNKLFEETNWKTKQWQEQVATIFKDLDEEARKQIMDAAAQITGTEIPNVKVNYDKSPGEYKYSVLMGDEGDIIGNKPPLSDIDTDNFKAFFRGSKVVDGEGKPLVVYHSSPNDFTEFNGLSHFGTEDASLERNFQTWENKDYPDNYTGYIYPTYLSIKNPIELPDVFTPSGLEENKEILKSLGLGEEFNKKVDLFKMNGPKEQIKDTYKSLYQGLRDKGYDGIKYINDVEDFGSTSWVAFEPNQIKSATGNIGTFSKNSDNILYVGYDKNPGQYRFPVDSETGKFDFIPQDIDTPEFKRWFNGSKVVDENGSPLIMYHGTSSKEPFTVFNTNPPKDVGAHFGTKDAAKSILAGSFEATKDTNNMLADVYPVYLNIKNPLEVQDAFGGDVAGTALEIHDALQARGANLYDLTERLKKQTEILDNWPDMETEYMGMTWDEFVASNIELDKYAVEIAKKNGFDGLVYENIFEGDVFGDNLSWVAFEPNQIKSATGNIGTFSKNSDNILYAEMSSQGDNIKYNQITKEWKKTWEPYYQVKQKMLEPGEIDINPQRTLTGAEPGRYRLPTNEVANKYPRHSFDIIDKKTGSVVASIETHRTSPPTHTEAIRRAFQQNPELATKYGIAPEPELKPLRPLFAQQEGIELSPEFKDFIRSKKAQIATRKGTNLFSRSTTKDWAYPTEEFLQNIKSVGGIDIDTVVDEIVSGIDKYQENGWITTYNIDRLLKEKLGIGNDVSIREYYPLYPAVRDKVLKKLYPDSYLILERLDDYAPGLARPISGPEDLLEWLGEPEDIDINDVESMVGYFEDYIFDDNNFTTKEQLEDFVGKYLDAIGSEIQPDTLMYYFKGQGMFSADSPMVEEAYSDMFQDILEKMYGDKEDPLYAQQEFPIFVSKLQETVDKMPNRMSVEEFKNYLAGKQIKKEELKWTFIDDLLEGKTHVTKAEVQQWVAGNKLEVQEVWYTRGKPSLIDIPDNAEDLADLTDYWVFDDIDYLVENRLDEWHEGSLDGFFTDDTWLNNLTPETMSDMLMGDLSDFIVMDRVNNRLNEQQIAELAEEAYGNFESFDIDPPFTYEEFYPVFRDRAQQFTTRQLEGIVDQNGTQMLEHYAENNTRHSQYTQPGGEDYTELVFTLPEGYDIPMGKSDLYYIYNAITGEVKEGPLEDISKIVNTSDGEWSDPVAVKPNNGSSFKHRAHWGDLNNPVAHTRFDTRYTEDGRKVLFIDEIQSDWHQQGRDKGYVGDTIDLDDWKIEGGPKPPSEPGYADIYLMVNSKNERISVTASSNEKAYLELAERLKKDRIPDAPFRNTWDEYVQKRLLRYAADNGYDGIAWSTGKQQADRWHQAITENIDTIQYNQDSQWLRAYKGNEEVLSRRIPKEKLSETVGADVARQLLDTTPDTFTIQPINKNPNTEGLIDRMPPDMDPVEMLRWMNEQPEYKASVPYDSIEKPTSYQVVDQNGNAWGYIYHSEEAAQKAIDDLQVMGETMKTVSGTNITVGGEGMRKFYDQQIPSNFKKLGKKFGLSIDEIELDFTSTTTSKSLSDIGIDDFEDFMDDLMTGMDGLYSAKNESELTNVLFNNITSYLDSEEWANYLGTPSPDILKKISQETVSSINTPAYGLDVKFQERHLSEQLNNKLVNHYWPDGVEAKPRLNLSKQQGMWLDPKSRQAIRQQSFPLYAKQDAQGPVDNLTAGWSDRQITALDNFLKWRNSVVKQYRQLGIPINELEKYVPFIPKRVLRGEEADVVKTVFGTGVEQATGDNFDTLLAELSKMDPNLRQRTTKATRPSEVNKLLKSDWLTEDAAVAMSLRGTRAIKAQEFSKFGDEFIAEYGLHATDITKMTGGSVPEGYVAYKVGLDQEGNKIFQQARDVVGATMDDTEIIFLPEEMVNLYNEYLGIMFNKQKKNGLVQIYDSMSRLYKKAAYLWNPGHVFRDFQGNVFNNYLMGVTDPMEYAEGLRVLRGAEGFLDTPNGQIPYKDIYEKAQQMGIIDSIMEHELPTLTGKTESGYSRAMRKATYATDGWTRMTGFIHNLKQGQSFEQAAATTKKFLFDYFDLTPFERKVMKRIIPFYTWTRKNIPLQLEVLVKNPRVFARINDVQNAIAGENIDWKEKPEYIQDMVGIQPKGSDMYVGMSLPYQDLTRLPINSNTLADLLSSINPIIRVPIESITNQKWWTGQELEKYPGEKTDIPVLTTLLEMLGQEQGPQIGARYGGNVLNNIPILTRAGNLLDAVSGKETNDVRNLSRVSTTIGGPAFFDAASVENSADWQERQRLIDLIQLLQDEGYNIPTSGEARKEGRYRKLSRLLSR